MKTSEETQEWYNSFADEQIKAGVNIRHYTLMRHFFNLGLKRNHSVLEIGCGIGTLTGLLNKYLNKGKLVAADISDKSIETAKRRIKNSQNIEFVVTDMKDFSSPEKFDFIILPDVLEHIPIEQHQNLFRITANLMHDNSQLVIHIPHPKMIDFIRINTPEKLQIIDQAISADKLLNDAYHNNLALVNYLSYSLYYYEKDYVLINFKKNIPVNFNAYSKNIIVKNKFIARVIYFLKTL